MESRDGVWDVRDIDFASSGARLMGSIEYVPHELLSPVEFASSERIVIAQIPDGTSYLTVRIRVLAQEGMYAFSRIAPDYATSVYVNGELLGSAGVPSDSQETAVFGERLYYFTAQPVDGVIEIVVQSSNFAHRDTSSQVGWQMNSEDAMSRWVTGYLASSAFVMGFLLLLFIVHMLLFLSLPSYRANLWIALLCLMWALRAGCTGFKILLVLLPGLPWAVAFRIEYLAVPAALLLMTLAYHQLFPGVLQKGFRVGAYCVSGLFGVLYLFASTLFMSQTILYMEIVAILAGIYVIARLLMKLRKPSTEQRVIILGLCIILLGLIADTFFYNLYSVTNLILPGPVAEYAFVAFSLFQMTALFLGTMREIAAAKDNEQRLIRENAELDSRNRFERDLMTNLTHEMRTPLAVMSSYAQLAVKDINKLNADPQTTKDLLVIQDEAKRLAELATSFLDLYHEKGNTKNRGSLHLGDLLEQVGHLCIPMMKGNRNRLVLSIPEYLPPVYANADEIIQVILNLIANANNHTADGEISLSAESTQQEIVITVADTGTGIAPDRLPHVFERGETDGDGAGLGLDICRQVIGAHGGMIQIESKPAEGTTVWFTLPAREEGESDGYQGNHPDC
ncbi:MAG: sensor histidine kinase [Coriobacteriia bacterium]|nr:sensor histidine kinase [Coriobacteriia bacterium]